jgi:hypothetical protein
VRDAIAFPLARRGSFGVRAAAAVSAQRSVDVRRRFGRLPADQDDLEAWLTGHCERVAARGPRALSPAVVRFQEFMGTQSGFAAFRDPRINAALKGVLDEWSQSLCSPASLSVLNESPTG